MAEGSSGRNLILYSPPLFVIASWPHSKPSFLFSQMATLEEDLLTQRLLFGAKNAPCAGWLWWYHAFR